EPPPIWKDVMDVVAKHRLPISMSSKPDFSDFVDEKGVSHPRSGENPKPKSSDVVARLCQHIVQKRQKMIVDTNQTEVVWSDGAILEVGTNFPGALQELISRPTHHHDIRSFVKQLEAGSTSQWRDASVARSARGDSYATIRSSDGKISASVESLYVEYLAHRYPTAIIRVRRESEPVIFVVDGKIRASVMPVRF
ncbi:MAG: hypothetical protein WC429_18610, partial [Verrucomicrobiia bacterium]